MKTCMSLGMLLAVMAGCTTLESGTVKQGLTTATPISIEAGTGLALDEVVARLKPALHSAHGTPPAIIVEFEPGLDSTGKFTLQASYSSLASLVSDLDGQYGKYTWEVLAGDIVFVSPATGSYLTSTLPAGTYSAPAFCTLLRTFGEKVFPSADLSRPTTCMYRGAPRYRADIPAQVLSSQKLLGTGSDPVVSVSVAQGDRVIDAVVTAFDEFGFRFSASVAPLLDSVSIPPTWMLSF